MLESRCVILRRLYDTLDFRCVVLRRAYDTLDFICFILRRVFHTLQFRSFSLPCGFDVFPQKHIVSYNVFVRSSHFALVFQQQLEMLEFRSVMLRRVFDILEFRSVILRRVFQHVPSNSSRSVRCCWQKASFNEGVGRSLFKKTLVLFDRGTPRNRGEPRPPTQGTLYHMEVRTLSC